MSPSTLGTILTSIASVFVGGGLVQLFIFLLRRRAELRKLDAATRVDQVTADSTLSKSYKEQVDSYKEQVRQLTADGADYRERIRDAQAKIERLEARQIQVHREFTAQLEDAHAGSIRLSSRIAQLQTDVDIRDQQIAELLRRIGS